MLFSDKEKRYKKLLIIVLVLFIVLLVFVFLALFSIPSLNGFQFGSKTTYDIAEYDYHLRSNATDYQIELFNELDELIKSEADDISIAESVVKNYVADTYTWNNKAGQWDVGGMYYVHSPSKTLIYLQTKDDFYSLLDEYQEKYGKDGLLEVSSVVINSSKKSEEFYEFYEHQYECFEISCAWEYTEDSRFSNEISSVQNFLVIKNEDGRFEIAECYGNQF